MCAVMQTGVVPTSLMAREPVPVAPEIPSSVPFYTEPDDLEAPVLVTGKPEESDIEMLFQTGDDIKVGEDAADFVYRVGVADKGSLSNKTQNVFVANKPLSPKSFFDADKTLPAEPVQEGVWKKHLLKSVGEKLYQAGVWACQEIGDLYKVGTARHKAIDKERALKCRQKAVDKMNQWRLWDRVAMADQQKVRVARDKEIERELDRLAGFKGEAPNQGEIALNFLIAEMMRGKTKQAPKPLGKTHLFHVAEGQFRRWEGCRAHVKEALKLTDEKNADLFRQDVSTHRIAEGLLKRLNKDNSVHVRAALKALSESKTVERYIITWLKQEFAELDLHQKRDRAHKRFLKRFIDCLSDDTTLGWQYKSKAYDILGENDFPHYTVALAKIVDGVQVTDL